MIKSIRRRLFFSEVTLSFVLFLTLFLVYLLFSIGLNGPFLFDDIPNLSPLMNFGGVTDLPSALYFVFGNESGPLGRPISMATFLLNDQTWPSDPYSFKYTNLLFHLVNGCLVFVLLQQVGRQLNVPKVRSQWLAIGAVALWLMHPLNVSTVLYVIQRMTILSTMATLVALILYMRNRSALVNPKVSRQFFVLIQIGFVAILGLLCKETASVLVVYITILELIVFSKRRDWFVFRCILVAGCVAFLMAIIFNAFVLSANTWDHRDFNWIERLLTESRVIWDYVFGILLPRSGGSGLMHDDFIISRGIFDPWNTLISLIGIIGVLLVAFLKRKQLPILSLTIFWFLGGHVLESTIIPLEIYFEHRNYLPMIFLLWSVFFFLSNTVRFRKLAISFAVSYFFLNIGVTFFSVQTWSERSLLENVWGAENASSPRAQQMKARQDLILGDSDGAIRTINQALLEAPQNHHLLMQKILLDCMQGKKIQIEEVELSFQGGTKSSGIFDGLSKLRGLMGGKHCEFVTTQNLLRFNQVFLNHKDYQQSNSLAYLYKEIATLYALGGDLSNAVVTLDKAYEADNSNIVYPINQAMWLSSAGLKSDALEYLEVAKNTKPKHILQGPQFQKLYLEAKQVVESR